MKAPVSFRQCFILCTLCYISTIGKAQSTNQQISQIKAQVTAINHSQNKYRKVKLEDTEETTEGNEVTAWFEGSSLKKISGSYYMEVGHSDCEFYFNHNQLIFYYAANYHYKIPMGAAPHSNVKTKSVDYERAYFASSQNIRYLLKPVKNLTTEQKNEAVKQILADAKRLAMLAKKAHK